MPDITKPVAIFMALIFTMTSTQAHETRKNKIYFHYASFQKNSFLSRNLHDDPAEDEDESDEDDDFEGDFYPDDPESGPIDG